MYLAKHQHRFRVYGVEWLNCDCSGQPANITSLSTGGIVHLCGEKRKATTRAAVGEETEWELTVSAPKVCIWSAEAVW